MKQIYQKYDADVYGIKKNHIPTHVIDILKRLNEAGFEAYLVGGCLRDMLKNMQPKDFDVVTSAYPEEVKALFNNCRLIGRRFRLAHVYFGRENIEVATFRSDERGEANELGQVINHNNFGTIETDAFRRDFTINALYYDLKDHSIIDFTGAINDISDGVIRIIGDADERYREDPVRILRALRFAAKLGMRIDSETERAISHQKRLLENIPHARLFDETVKLFLSGHALASYQELRIHGVFAELYPETDRVLNQYQSEEMKANRRLIKLALKNTDRRIKENNPVTIAFLYAVFFWPIFQEKYQARLQEKIHWYTALFDSINEVFVLTGQRLAIPARHKTMIKDIWTMQTRLLAPVSKKKIESILMHKRFRAGFDFLELRLESGEDLESAHQLWVKAQLEMPDALYVHKKYPKKRRRRK